MKEITASEPYRYVCLSACKDKEQAVATESGSLFTRGLAHAVEQASGLSKTALRSTGKHAPITMRGLRDQAEFYIQTHVSDPSKMHHPQLFGNVALQTKDLKVEPVAEVPKPWRQLEYMVSKAQYTVPITLNQTRQKVGDALVITCEPPEDGYINVLEAGRGDEEITVLYPNGFHPENAVRTHTRVSIPAGGEFVLKAVQPDQNLIVVIVTDRPLNGYKDGDGDAKALFKCLSPKTMRASHQAVAADSGVRFGAGKVVNHVE